MEHNENKDASVMNILKTCFPKEITNEKNLEVFLIEKLKIRLPNCDENYIREKVSAWLKDDVTSLSRKDAVELGTAFGLSPKQISELMELICPKNEMTEISMQRINYAMEPDLTVMEAVRFLEKNTQPRTVLEVLNKYIDPENIRNQNMQNYLVQKLKIVTPDANEDSIRRNVANWMKENCCSISKQNAIKLCFALELTPEQTDELLKFLCKEGLHYRENEDIIYAYALRKRLPYMRAIELLNAVKKGNESESKVNPQNRQKRKTKKEPVDEKPLVLTQIIKNEVLRINNDDELIAFLTERSDDLGKLHNTAFIEFRSLMNLLHQPEVNGYFGENEKKEEKSEETETAKKIAEENLYNGLVSRIHGENNQANINALQRMIHQNWPDNTLLSKMMNRETNVSRKALILLFLATDGGYSEYGTVDNPYEKNSNTVNTLYGDFIDEIPAEDRFKETYIRLNTMLSDCGFPEIDPRNEFDWMVLYCLCSEDDESEVAMSPIDQKMREFLNLIFT